MEGTAIRIRFIYISKTKEPKVEAIEVEIISGRIQRSRVILRQVFKAMEAGHVYPARHRSTAAVVRSVSDAVRGIVRSDRNRVVASIGIMMVDGGKGFAMNRGFITAEVRRMSVSVRPTFQLPTSLDSLYPWRLAMPLWRSFRLRNSDLLRFADGMMKNVGNC